VKLREILSTHKELAHKLGQLEEKLKNTIRNKNNF
jgi:hypothetical protein